jgi:DNA-binding transcriptional MerR regulator
MKPGATLASQPLTIGTLAGRSGFTVKALRYYDRRGLLPPAARRPRGHRLYVEADMHRLQFIRQAKALGLTLEAIRELMAAAGEHGGASTRTRLLRTLDDRIAQTTAQIGALTRLRQELQRRRSVLRCRRPRRGGGGYCTCLHETG